MKRDRDKLDKNVQPIAYGELDMSLSCGYASLSLQIPNMCKPGYPLSEVVNNILILESNAIRVPDMQCLVLVSKFAGGEFSEGESKQASTHVKQVSTHACTHASKSASKLQLATQPVSKQASKQASKQTSKHKEASTQVSK